MNDYIMYYVLLTVRYLRNWCNSSNVCGGLYGCNMGICSAEQWSHGACIDIANLEVC